MPHWGIFPSHCLLTVWCSGSPFIHGLRHSKLSCHTFSSAFRATSLVLAVQSHHHLFLVSTFRAIIAAFQFGVQSHRWFSDRHSESHPQFRRSEPSPCFQFGVQSHHRFSDRHSGSHPRFRRSESLSLLSLTFRVIVITF